MRLLSLLFITALGTRAAEINPPVALFVGDSLTAGYGVQPEEAWPAVLEAKWKSRGLKWRARNAAVSGSTSAGLKDSVAWALTPEVKLVFICIGANDGLRGLPNAETRRNIDAVVAGIQKRGVRVALAGMKIPPNYGSAYTKAFADIFPALAHKRRIPLLAFLLDGVAANPALNQEDGLHPNAAGHRIIAAHVDAFLTKEKLIP